MHGFLENPYTNFLENFIETLQIFLEESLEGLLDPRVKTEEIGGGRINGKHWEYFQSNLCCSLSALVA